MTDESNGNGLNGTKASRRKDSQATEEAMKNPHPFTKDGLKWLQNMKYEIGSDKTRFYIKNKESGTIVYQFTTRDGLISFVNKRKP